jgi:iron(III) transport system ATP-binding protein
MTEILIQNRTKRFGGTIALKDISINYPSGSFTSLLEPSGCGMTMLLRFLAV